MDDATVTQKKVTEKGRHCQSSANSNAKACNENAQVGVTSRWHIWVKKHKAWFGQAMPADLALVPSYIVILEYGQRQEK